MLSSARSSLSLVRSVVLLSLASACGDGATPPSASSSPPVDLDIIGGTNANIVDLPWQVALSYAPDPGYQFCGGSVIHASYILTANHCVEGETASGILVVA